MQIKNTIINTLIRQRFYKHKLNFQDILWKFSSGTKPEECSYAFRRSIRHDCFLLKRRTSLSVLSRYMHLQNSFHSANKSHGNSDDGSATNSSEVSQMQSRHHENALDLDNKSTDHPGYKDMPLIVSSARAVTIANKSFSLGTKKINEAFFDGRIRLNGKIIPKKNIKVSAGDVIDVVTETTDSQVILQRVKILMEEVETLKGNERFYIRRWKRLKLPLLSK